MNSVRRSPYLTTKPPSCTAWWCRRHRRTRLSTLVAPPFAQDRCDGIAPASRTTREAAARAARGERAANRGGIAGLPPYIEHAAEASWAMRTTDASQAVAATFPRKRGGRRDPPDGRPTAGVGAFRGNVDYHPIPPHYRHPDSRTEPSGNEGEASALRWRDSPVRHATVLRRRHRVRSSTSSRLMALHQSADLGVRRPRITTMPSSSTQVERLRARCRARPWAVRYRVHAAPPAHEPLVCGRADRAKSTSACSSGVAARVRARTRMRAAALHLCAHPRSAGSACATRTFARGAQVDAGAPVASARTRGSCVPAVARVELASITSSSGGGMDASASAAMDCRVRVCRPRVRRRRRSGRGPTFQRGMRRAWRILAAQFLHAEDGARGANDTRSIFGAGRRNVRGATESVARHICGRRNGPEIFHGARRNLSIGIASQNGANDTPTNGRKRRRVPPG
jgi:hypothetical protein